MPFAQSTTCFGCLWGQFVAASQAGSSSLLSKLGKKYFTFGPFSARLLCKIDHVVSRQRGQSCTVDATESSDMADTTSDEDCFTDSSELEDIIICVCHRPRLALHRHHTPPDSRESGRMFTFGGVCVREKFIDNQIGNLAEQVHSLTFGILHLHVCVCLLLQYLLQSCSRGGRGIVEDMCYERRRAEASAGESAHHALLFTSVV